MPNAHDLQPKFAVSMPARVFGGLDFRANVRSYRPREAAVNLALKWNVIAVCAAFVFVGAVLLGAF
jgi:hypothetical protein